MSPAQVERYLGPCIISPAGGRYRYPGYQGAWTGLPLIAIGRGKKEDRSPLSRLAIHTQGAPLIQSARQYSRRSSKQQQKPSTPKETNNKEIDESNNNSENALPRIIKPRKRRKKERKPQTETSIVTLKPYTPLCTELQQTTEEQPSSINEVAECQCRYCDPLGVIWEASSEPSTWPGESEDSGLQVSSEIVTMPNGHRDIEIRFFSSPQQPPAQPPRPVSVSPPWR